MGLGVSFLKATMWLDTQVVRVCGLVPGFHWPSLLACQFPSKIICPFCWLVILQNHFLKLQSLLLQRTAISGSEFSENKWKGND